VSRDHETTLLGRELHIRPLHHGTFPEAKTLPDEAIQEDL
jgi:hypothetical protein